MSGIFLTISSHASTFISLNDFLSSPFLYLPKSNPTLDLPLKYILNQKIEIMKSIVLTFALALIASFSFAQFPQSKSPDSCCYVANDLRAAIFMTNNSLINVKVAKKMGDKVKIRIKENNKPLYIKSYNKYEWVDLQYDISQFPEGKFTFEIVQNKEVVYTQTIDHQSITDQLVNN